MRRVYDDALYEELSKKIEKIVENIDPADVSEYGYGDYRASSSKISKVIKNELPKVKYGRYTNTTGIGNNESYELIYTGDAEEQIFGEIHLTDNMYGSIIVWVSDIDGKRTTASRTIHGSNPEYRRPTISLT